MLQLRNQLKDAQPNGVAVGHFDVSGLEFAENRMRGCRGIGGPGNRRRVRRGAPFLGVARIAGVGEKPARGTDIPIFLNADHTHSLEGAMAAAKAGFDSIV